MKMFLLAIVGGVAFAAAGLTYEAWTPMVVSVTSSVWTSISTPDPDHA